MVSGEQKANTLGLPDTTVDRAAWERTKHSQVVLYRRVSDQWTQATLLDVKKMENDHNLSEDVHLQPGDMLFVPKNKLSKIAPFIPSANVAMVPGTMF
jgi:hypothetical protein